MNQQYHINAKLAENTLRTMFPMKSKFINIGSQYPQDIIENVRQLSLNQTSALVMIQGDVWRYGDDYTLQSFLSQLKLPTFILCQTYQHRTITDNVFEISWPKFYFERVLLANKPTLKSNNETLWGFSCLNNKANVHRLLFGAKLHEHHLLEEMIFTQNVVNLHTITGFNKILLDHQNTENYCATLPLSWNEPHIHGQSLEDYSSVHDAYSKSFCNIVTETELQTFYWPGVAIDTPFISEKSYKPILSAQIPLYLAPKGHIAYLRAQGFEMFENILPDNFDYLGLHGKIHALVKLVSQGREWIQSIYNDYKHEIANNTEIIYSDVLDKKFYKDIKFFVDSKVQT